MVVGDGMVGSSNEISRETCQIQNVDGESSTIAVRNAAKKNVPGPAVRVVTADGNETATHDCPDDAADRSQSPHSSDDAREQNLVEPRGAGR